MALRKTGMVDRHWDNISGAVGFDIRPTEGFTLQTCIDKGLLAHSELCEDTGEKAYKEYNIEKSLKKMKDDWGPLKFLLPQFKATGTYIIAGFDDAVQLLDEHIVTAQAMKFSPFRGPFEEEIIEWCEKMMVCQDTLEEWVACQREWTYLQPIFDSPDIAAQLKSETKRFRSVDATWRSVMNECKQDPSILNNCSIDGLRDKFTEANKNLDIVRKGLNEYLEKKRTAFARFYFLSDDDLLEILSQTKEVKNVRPHLKKVFEAINDLVFDPNDCMLAMISAEKESINFNKKVDPSGKQVEFWMGDVEKTMCNTVR
jgi:dynein heavy chain